MLWGRVYTKYSEDRLSSSTVDLKNFFCGKKANPQLIGGIPTPLKNDGVRQLG